MSIREGNIIPRKYHIAKLYLQDDDPGDEFEMSEWFDSKKKEPSEESSLVLVQRENGEILKAIHFQNGFPVKWCTWEEGYAFDGKDIVRWAYIRKIAGKDRKGVDSWKSVSAKTSMSK